MSKNKFIFGWLILTMPLWWVVLGIVAYFMKLSDGWIAVVLIGIVFEAYWITGIPSYFGSWRNAIKRK